MRTDISDSEWAARAKVEELEQENKELLKAIKVLAHDRVHGVADIIGAAVLSNPIAADAINEAKNG